MTATRRDRWSDNGAEALVVHGCCVNYRSTTMGVQLANATLITLIYDHSTTTTMITSGQRGGYDGGGRGERYKNRRKRHDNWHTTLLFTEITRTLRYGYLSFFHTRVPTYTPYAYIITHYVTCFVCPRLFICHCCRRRSPLDGATVRARPCSRRAPARSENGVREPRNPKQNPWIINCITMTPHVSGIFINIKKIYIIIAYFIELLCTTRYVYTPCVKPTGP